MTWRRYLLAFLLFPIIAHADPAIQFDCKGSTDRRQGCSFSFDPERIEKAFQPIEAQAKEVNSPSEAMNVMAQAMTIFASLIQQKE